MPTNAIPVSTSIPPGMSNVEDGPIFSGDGPCPQCETLLWIDWYFSFDQMKCPACGFLFDADQALEILCGHEPDKNKGNVAVVKRLLQVKKVMPRALTELEPAPNWKQQRIRQLQAKLQAVKGNCYVALASGNMTQFEQARMRMDAIERELAELGGE